MYSKHNRWYADWRDKRGQRKRRAFTTPEAAEAYEAAQKAKARPNVHRSVQPSRTSSAPRSYGAGITFAPQPPAPSSRKRAAKHPPTSRGKMSTPSSRKSRAQRARSLAADGSTPSNTSSPNSGSITARQNSSGKFHDNPRPRRATSPQPAKSAPRSSKLPHRTSNAGYSSAQTSHCAAEPPRASRQNTTTQRGAKFPIAPSSKAPKPSRSQRNCRPSSRLPGARTQKSHTASNFEKDIGAVRASGLQPPCARNSVASARPSASRANSRRTTSAARRQSAPSKKPPTSALSKPYSDTATSKPPSGISTTATRR